ncbi:MAG: ribosomal protein [Candidatus Midichloriaceae bacterium]|jgi:large subunit ribosomal protein L9|nr:ribosomal protein [Candidatus Midichloriaceae bacterium]
MEVILLEKIAKLGNIGSRVEVKDGFARNFLLPRGKALRANKANVAYFEAQQAEIEKANQERKTTAEAAIGKFEGLSITIARQASEDGKLYGAVSSSDVAKAVSDKVGESVGIDCIYMPERFKNIGSYEVVLVLHPDVQTNIQVVVSRD